MSKPLTKLLEKETDFFRMKKQESFDGLKEALCNPPILQYPDFSKPFIITTDASGYAIGGILSQGEIGKDLPISYASRVLRGPELHYEVYEKESLAMIHCAKLFRSYIYNRKISFVTDHQPLVWFKTADCNTRVQKWRFKLSEFDYEVIYKPGRLNANADALSRNPFCNVVTRKQTMLISDQNKIITNLVKEQDPIRNTIIPKTVKKSIVVNNELNNNEINKESEFSREVNKKRISKK